MNWEQALRSRLLDSSDVAGEVGTKVAWGVAPQKWKPPFVILTVISDPRPKDLDGFILTRASLVQLDCYGIDREQSATIKEYVIAAIEGAGVFDGVSFSGGFIDSVRDLGENTDTGFIHRISIDAQIWHN